MKFSISICIILSINVILSGCSSGTEAPSINSESEQKDSISQLNEPVYIRAQGQSTPDKRVVVTGESNLPDATELLVSLINEAIGFQAQDKVSVTSGKYSSDPLGPKSGLTSGNYTIEVLMPISATQPESVQRVIGNEGQSLFGPLVEESTWGGKIVEYSTSFMFGSSKDIKNAEKNYSELVANVRKTIADLLEAGRSMEKHRGSESLADAKICGELMRKNHAEAKEVRSRSEELDLKYFDLRTAAIDIHSCVSCSLSAEEACVRVEESLAKSQ